MIQLRLFRFKVFGDPSYLRKSQGCCRWAPGLRFFWSFVIMLFLNPCMVWGWGFMAHRYINESAVYLLPPPLLGYMLPYKEMLRDRAVSADQRRAWDSQEAPRHFIDLDRWGDSVFCWMPHKWESAILCYSEDSLRAHGILPWHAEKVYRLLVHAFAKEDASSVVRYAADLGHYLADAHVPLHLCSNYNGQFTGQHGIHALLESRIPEYFIAATPVPNKRPQWIPDVRKAIWDIIRESSSSLPRVFDCERQCRSKVPRHLQYSPIRVGQRLARKESYEFVECYHNCLEGLMGQRLSASVWALASWWYSAWIEAGQPSGLRSKPGLNWKQGSETGYAGELPVAESGLDSLGGGHPHGQFKSGCEDW